MSVILLYFSNLNFTVKNGLRPRSWNKFRKNKNVKSSPYASRERWYRKQSGIVLLCKSSANAQQCAFVQLHAVSILMKSVSFTCLSLSQDQSFHISITKLNYTYYIENSPFILFLVYIFFHLILYYNIHFSIDIENLEYVYLYNSKKKHIICMYVCVYFQYDFYERHLQFSSCIVYKIKKLKHSM